MTRFDPMDELAGAVAWTRPGDLQERNVLRRWAQGVGRPATREPAYPPGMEALDELTFVVWNTNVGAGHLSGLVTDLRRGILTDGRPVEHFVLLLQEVHREGAVVPEHPSASSAGAARVAGVPPVGRRIGIDVFADLEGLALHYVPSMRNGALGRRARPEDRGNAILSTLPLAAPRAYELPFERQRRVAVAATVRGFSTRGSPWSLDCVNVHLDPRSARWRFHRSFGSGRARQTEWLLGAIEGDVPTLVGGDFNTWTRGADERAVRHMQSRFHRPATRGGTFAVSRFLPSLELDHVFLRLPEGWRSECQVLPVAYGSDHRPLVGWIRVDSPGEPLPR